MYPWDNTTINGINTEDSVVQAYNYKSVEDALKDENKSIISLNGRWKYKIFENVHSVVENFYDTEFEDSNWERASVPSILKEDNHEETYTYYNYIGAFRKNSIPKITGKSNRVIIYRRSFYVSKQHNTGEFYLCFEGMIHSFNIYLNGKYVGYSYGKLTPIEFKVSDNIREGNNTICIEMVEFSDSTYLHSKDCSILGIMRSVFIYYEPKLHIRDINVVYSFKEDISDCDLKVQLKLRGNGVEFEKYSIKVMLGEYGYSPKRIGEISCKDMTGEKNIECEFELKNINIWSCENPNLYNIIFKVVDDCNEIVTIKKQVIGFREVMIKNNILMINRKRAEIKGINGANLFNKEHKYPENEKSFEEEVKRLKQFNINSIIINEYPYPQVFYKYCDIYGIYVVDEVEIGNFNRRIGKRIVNDEQLLRCCKDRVISMIERGKNHPSIIMWSLSRILSFGENIEKLYETIKKLDKSRPVFYLGDNELAVSDVFAVKEGTPNFQRVTGELKELSYPIKERIKNITRGFVTTSLERYKNKPILYLSYGGFNEYPLGMLNEHLNEFKKYENWIGGFLNIHSSNVIVSEENYNIIKRKKHNVFIENGIINPLAYEIKKCFQSINVEIIDREKMIFEIKNNYKFITTEKFDCIIKFTKDGEVLSTQVVKYPIVAPYESCIIDLNHYNIENKIGDFNQIEFSFILNENTECYEVGAEVAWEQFEFKREIEGLCSASKEYCNLFSKDKKNKCFEEYTINNKPNNLKIKNISERYLITGKNFQVSVCKVTGNIRMEVKRNSSFNKGYLMEVCSASISDFEKNKLLLLKVLDKLNKKLSDHKRVIGQEIILEADCIIIYFDIKERLLGHRFSQIYKIYDSGKIYCNYTCEGVRNSKNFITNINILSRIKEGNWCGRGPYESHPWTKNGMKYGKFKINLNEDKLLLGRRSDVKNFDFILEDGVYNSVKFMSEVDVVLKKDSMVEDIKNAPLSMDILSDEKVDLNKSGFLYYEKNNLKKNNNKELEFIIKLGSD
ncbi:glycoside hydrolase family 2 TIM barrel-domain containing protein [Oceanirhabdus seepicola]|uniref:beta-galactosidase n=1 Tax=Oceanirhabdus seepicola TaxID=2828781 RepID=A0A9J6P4I6_9CLOT|nr:glycoside hydrolase family 2 TIM barrel-domain containing protein [Oceanirhabdus seepicola]MCM1991009.1 DUF4981 domain-containing protein [Oceanirhabdus seepicola]